jgi:hypothetical protein
MVLQNRRGLDLLTAEKGGLYLFLGEDCCFFTNKSGIVRGGMKKPKERAHQLTSSQPTNIISSLYPWLIPLVVPLILVCLALMFLPCLFNIFKIFYRNVLLPSPEQPQGNNSKPSCFYKLSRLEEMRPPPHTHCPQPAGSSQKTNGAPMPYITKPRMLECWNAEEH